MCLSIFTEAVCCAGKSFCNLFCCCCKKTCGTAFKQQVKLAYIILLAISLLFTVFCLYSFAKILDPFKRWIHCPQESGGKLQCLGLSAVYRMSITLATLFILMLLACLTRNKIAKSINEGIWVLKIIYVAGIFVLFLFVSNTFFEGYRDFARIASGFFLLFQLVMLIDLFYMWGGLLLFIKLLLEKWVEKYDAGTEIWKYILIITAFLLYAGIGVFIFLDFKYFGYANDCSLQFGIVGVNIFLVILSTVLMLCGIIQNNSLITSGAMCLYISYLTFSGLGSNPNENCNKLYYNNGMITQEIVINGLIILISLVYLAVSTKDNSSKRIQFGNGDLNSQILGNKEDENGNQLNLSDEEANKNLIKKDEDEAQDKYKAYKSNNWIFFHIVMIFASIYICMLLTNWGQPNINNYSSILNAYTPNSISFWIKIGCSWCGAFLLIWTILAPKIMTNRQFPGQEMQTF